MYLHLPGYTGGDPANINVNGVEPGIETTSIYPVARTFTLGIIRPILKTSTASRGCSNTTRKALSGKPVVYIYFVRKASAKGTT